jgi:hypothetical protein
MMCGYVEVYPHSFLCCTWDTGQWSALCFGRFVLGRSSDRFVHTGRWSPIASVGAVVLLETSKVILYVRLVSYRGCCALVIDFLIGLYYYYFLFVSFVFVGILWTLLIKNAMQVSVLETNVLLLKLFVLCFSYATVMQAVSSSIHYFKSCSYTEQESSYHCSENAPAWFWHIFSFDFFVNRLTCTIGWMNSLLEGTSSPYWALTCKIPRSHLISFLKILAIRWSEECDIIAGYLRGIFMQGSL